MAKRSKFLKRIMSEADLIQGYTDFAINRLEEITESERQELLIEIKGDTGYDGADDMGALAVIEWLINNFEPWTDEEHEED